MKSILLLSFGILFAFAQPPIPSTYPGHNRGNSTGPILFEAYFDHICSDSATAWPVIQQVYQYYKSQMHFVLHIFPLPFHRNAFYAAQGGLVVESMRGEDAFFSYVESVFQNQPVFYNDATADLTATEVITMFGKLAEPLGVSMEDFVSGMKYGNRFDSNGRTDWKFAAARGVYRTPLYFVNGVAVTADQTWTFSQWQQLFGSLLPQTSQTSS